VNWAEAFNKFGHGDGDDCCHTPKVVEFLRRSFAVVEVDELAHHNPIIDKIVDAAGVEVWPRNEVAGYTDPTCHLPAKIVANLNQEFGEAEWYL
jgi:hypothetical protein